MGEILYDKKTKKYKSYPTFRFTLQEYSEEGINAAKEYLEHLTDKNEYPIDIIFKEGKLLCENDFKKDSWMNTLEKSPKSKSSELAKESK